MEASKKVWIRGNERGEDVIKILTDLGATNPINYNGNNKDSIYFINYKNEICNVNNSYEDKIFAEIIMEEYEELYPL